MPMNLELLLNLVVKPRATFDKVRVESFIAHWKAAPGGNKDANSKPFFTQLFDLMGLKPSYNAEGEISFEKTVVGPGEPGATRNKKTVYAIVATGESPMFNIHEWCIKRPELDQCINAQPCGRESGGGNNDGC